MASTRNRGSVNGCTVNGTSSTAPAECHATFHVPARAARSSGNDPATTPQSPAGAASSSSTSPPGSVTTQLPGRWSSGVRSRARSATARNRTVLPGWYSGRSVITWIRAGAYTASAALTSPSPSSVR
ncbi:MAG TPA: hypothetical protein VHT91_00980 [Kofleriaceae bacterium]|nr:hypothetical protein [Kofleriaceae bacterium]